MDELDLKGVGSQKWQNDYISFLLKEANKLNAKFIIWFVPRDYKHLLDKLKSMVGSD